MTALEQAVKALRELADALEKGALDPQPTDGEFATVEEACRALGIKAKKHKEKALVRRAKGRGYVRREGYSLVIERKGLLAHVRSLEAA